MTQEEEIKKWYCTQCKEEARVRYSNCIRVGSTRIHLPLGWEICKKCVDKYDK